MKTDNRFFSILTIGVVLIGILVVSCSKNDLANGGNPEISYVRVTDPAKSDSLLGAGLLGNLVVIVGENLASTREIWFNDQQAILNPTYVTNRNILVSVPNQAPVVITNQMKLVFANGKSLLYDFPVSIPAPVLTGMMNEWPQEGDAAVLQGNYFFKPFTIKFSDGTAVPDANILSATQTEIQFTVPANAPSGALTLKTAFGVTSSTTFQFRDKRNIFASMDSAIVLPGGGGWWHGDSYILDDSSIPEIAEKYMLIDQNFGAYPYFEFMVGPVGTGMQLGTQNIPADAILNPADYTMKMEIFTKTPLSDSSAFQLYIGNNMPGDRNTAGDYYTWTPVVNTKGKWMTITVGTSFKDVLIPGANKSVVVNPLGYDISFIVQGNANPFKGYFAFDNVRVVPK